MEWKNEESDDEKEWNLFFLFPFIFFSYSVLLKSKIQCDLSLTCHSPVSIVGGEGPNAAHGEALERVPYVDNAKKNIGLQ